MVRWFRSTVFCLTLEFFTLLVGFTVATVLILRVNSPLRERVMRQTGVDPGTGKQLASQ